MQFARTLSAYIARQFFAWFCGVFGTMVGVTFLLDYVELIRRGGTRSEADLGSAVGNGGAEAAAHGAGRDAVRHSVRHHARPSGG